MLYLKNSSKLFKNFLNLFKAETVGLAVEPVVTKHFFYLIFPLNCQNFFLLHGVVGGVEVGNHFRPAFVKESQYRPFPFVLHRFIFNQLMAEFLDKHVELVSGFVFAFALGRFE